MYLSDYNKNVILRLSSIEQQRFYFLRIGFLRLLFEKITSLGHSPVVRRGHGGTTRTTTGWPQPLPIFPGGPGPHPRLGVHLEATRPGNMLLTGLGNTASLLRQFLGHSSDVVGLETTTSSNVSDTELIGFTSIFMDVKPLINALE